MGNADASPITMGLFLVSPIRYSVHTMKQLRSYPFLCVSARKALWPLVLSIVVLALSCSPEKQEALVVYGLAGPSSVGMAKMFVDNNPSLSPSTPSATTDANNRLPGAAIRPEILPGVDIMTAKFASGEAVAGILPPNVAAKLAAKGIGIQVAAVVGQGMLSILGRDASITGPGDLKEKTVHVAAAGSTPDYVFRRILAANGLEAGTDITLEFSLPTPEIAQGLIAGRIDIAVLPEPFASMALRGNKELRELFDVQSAWGAATGVSDYPMTVLVVSRDWAKKSRKSVEALLGAYRASVDWVLANPDDAALVAEAAGIGVKAVALRQAIPRSAYRFTSAREARSELETLYQLFLAFDSASIGGALPADSFYWQ